MEGSQRVIMYIRVAFQESSYFETSLILRQNILILVFFYNHIAKLYQDIEEHDFLEILVRGDVQVEYEPSPKFSIFNNLLRPCNQFLGIFVFCQILNKVLQLGYWNVASGIRVIF